MGRILEPPKRIRYNLPNGEFTGTIVAQVMRIEPGRAGEYACLIQLIEWDSNDPPEVRFGYYYREHGGGDEDWNWVRNALNMRPETLIALLRDARNNPQFRNVLDEIQFRDIHL